MGYGPQHQIAHRFSLRLDEPDLANVAIFSHFAGVPRAEDIERIRACAVKDEDLKVIEGVAYLHTPHGFGNCKMAAKFDAWIGVTNTARNWNTVLKLAELGRVAEL